MSIVPDQYYITIADICKTVKKAREKSKDATKLSNS